MKKQTILAVDDAPENIDLLNLVLGAEYNLKVALDGDKALAIASNPADLPDLILLDVMMPGMDGYQVCRQLKTNALTYKIPVIFVSAMSEVGDETRGFEVGAVDYITKPISAPLLRARVKTHLELYDQTRLLEQRVRQRTAELEYAHDVAINGFATLAEFRDQETGAHILRTRQYVRLLAQYLSVHPRFSSYLTAEEIDLLYKSAPLHDIGKIAVPDRILLKPGKLTPEEFDEMKKHTTYGRDAIARAEQSQDAPQNSFLRLAREIAYTHHEKWNGSGYPQGLAGEAIPISGRLMALADIYDALISKRVYKAALPHDLAVEIITEESGRQLDPDVVDAFLDLQDTFANIARTIIDEPVQR